MGLCLSSLLKCSLTWSSPTDGEFALFQTFPLSLGAWDSWRLVISIKASKKRQKKHWVLQPYLCPLSLDPLPHQDFIFLVLHFAADVPVEAFLVAVPILCQIRLHRTKRIPACSDSASVFLLDLVCLLLPFLFFLFIFEFSLEVCVHACRSSLTFAWFPAHWDGPVSGLERCSLKIN